MFSTQPKSKILVVATANLLSAYGFNLVHTKNLLFGEELSSVQSVKQCNPNHSMQADCG